MNEQEIDTPEAAPVDGAADQAADLVRRAIVGPPSGALRFKFFLTGCLFPAVCIALAAFIGGPPTIKAPWQSGNAEDYHALLLTWPCLAFFLPLFTYSILSLATWTIWPKSQCSIVTRLGIYSGVPLAACFLSLIISTSYFITFIFAAIVAPFLAFIVFVLGYFVKRVKRFSILHLLLFMTVVGVLFGLLQLTDSWRRVLESPILIAAATPTLNFITYLRAATMLSLAPKANESSSRYQVLSEPICWAISLAVIALAWFTTWKIAIEFMFVEYNKLPTTDPNCYLSAAAQHRHRWLLGDSAEGVSLQTKRLKFLEIALRCAAPNFHATLRQIYDHFGPPLATYCRKSPWFADMSYLLLLPLELTAIALAATLRIPPTKIKDLYRPN